jgi:hypothetical protein
LITEIAIEYVIVTAGALALDWCGFGALKNTARSFRPLVDDYSYSSTLLPRALLFPVAAALLVFGKHSESYSIPAGIAGLLLWAATHVSIWLRVMRERSRNPP